MRKVCLVLLSAKLVFVDSFGKIRRLVREDFQSSDDQIVQDLREALTYAVMEGDAEKMSLIDLHTLRKDWLDSHF